MTAILGMHYLDGVLMMAETEESLGPDAKSQCEKLYRFTFPATGHLKPSGTVVTGGTGDSHLIDAVNGQLHLAMQQDIISRQVDVLGFLNEFARRFIRETMEPYQGIAYDAIPRPFEMLIAVNIQSVSLLFCWKGSRVNRLPNPAHTAIGVGVTQIHPLLTDLQFSASKECMLFHGMRLMFLAKRAVVGVGGRTEAIALQNNGTTQYFGTEVLQQVEDLMINYEQFKTKILDANVSTVFCQDKRIEPELEKNVEAAWTGLTGILKHYRQSYKSNLDGVSVPNVRRSVDLIKRELAATVKPLRL